MSAGTATGPIGVVVVDDQLPFRRAARRMFAAAPKFTIIGEAATGEEAVELIRSLRPKLVLMDVLLPGIDGIEATRRILSEAPATVVVLVSTRRRADLPQHLNESGAVFIQKENLDPEVLRALVA